LLTLLKQKLKYQTRSELHSMYLQHSDAVR